MSYQLLQEARRLTSLGYQIGLTDAKNLVGQYHNGTIFDGSWNGISIILKDIVCVDFDTHLSMDVGWGKELPPTLKEKTPRGFHLFYLLPLSNFKRISRIKWREHVDLLTEGKKIRYGQSTFESHALCFPTPGYTRMYPDVAPPKDQLTSAPKWLLEELK